MSIQPLSVAVCDDEILIRHSLTAKVNNYLIKNHIEGNVAEFSRGSDLISQDSYFDIVLLDIEMNGIDGMQTAKSLRKQGNDCSIIFVTSHSSYVYESFDVDASNFLVKPVPDEKLYAAMDRTVSRALKKNEEMPSLAVQKGSGILRIRFRDILFCEAVNHKLIIHTNAGVVDYYGSIADLEAKLDDNFFRCHRSYIVNLKHVTAYEKDAVLFNNGERALVSRRRSAEVSQKLLDTIRNEFV